MSGLEGREQMARMLDRLRAAPPETIAGLAVTAFEDLRDEDGRFGPLKGATDRASRNVLVFLLGESGRVVLRPSGTEPKAKIYIEACSAPYPAGQSESEWLQTCRGVDELLQQLSTDFVRQALATIGLEPSAAGAR
jgi:phosphoglucomutase/phosphomannomutase